MDDLAVLIVAEPFWMLFDIAGALGAAAQRQVEQDSHAVRVRRGHERAQIGGLAERVVERLEIANCIWVARYFPVAVPQPVFAAGKLPDWHQAERVDAQRA